jgi:hypothetical protein
VLVLALVPGQWHRPTESKGRRWLLEVQLATALFSSKSQCLQ